MCESQKTNYRIVWMRYSVWPLRPSVLYFVPSVYYHLFQSMFHSVFHSVLFLICCVSFCGICSLASSSFCAPTSAAWTPRPPPAALSTPFRLAHPGNGSPRWGSTMSRQRRQQSAQTSCLSPHMYAQLSLSLSLSLRTCTGGSSAVVTV